MYFPTKPMWTSFLTFSCLKKKLIKHFNKHFLQYSILNWYNYKNLPTISKVLQNSTKYKQDPIDNVIIGWPLPYYTKYKLNRTNIQFNLTFLQAHTTLLTRLLVHIPIPHLSLICLLAKSPNSVKPKESEHCRGFHSHGHQSPKIENQWASGMNIFIQSHDLKYIYIWIKKITLESTVLHLIWWNMTEHGDFLFDRILNWMLASTENLNNI